LHSCYTILSDEFTHFLLAKIVMAKFFFSPPSAILFVLFCLIFFLYFSFCCHGRKVVSCVELTRWQQLESHAHRPLRALTLTCLPFSSHFPHFPRIIPTPLLFAVDNAADIRLIVVGIGEMRWLWAYRLHSLIRRMGKVDDVVDKFRWHRSRGSVMMKPVRLIKTPAKHTTKKKGI